MTVRSRSGPSRVQPGLSQPSPPSRSDIAARRARASHPASAVRFVSASSSMRAPASVKCACPDEPVSMRARTASTTCPAAAGPKRASHARCAASELRMVPVAVASPSRTVSAGRGFDSVRVSVSPSSSCASSSSATETFFAVSPAAKASVPEVAV